MNVRPTYRFLISPSENGIPLARAKPLTLEAIAQYPIVTYDFAFANRSLVEKAFEHRGLAPKVVLTALDADVIKTYVELGLGVGVMARMAFDAKRDRGLVALDASHLFASSTTRLGIKRGAYLRRYAYEFIELFAPHLPREVSHLVQCLLAKTPLRRPTAAALVPQLCRLEIASLDTRCVVTFASEQSSPA